MGDIMDRTAVILGAGTGLGQAAARRFGREGHRIALVARSRPRLDALAAELRTAGVEAAAFVADFSRTQEVPHLVTQVRERFGRIDVVSYAPSGLEGFVPAAALTAETMRRYLDIYLNTPIELVRAILPELRARGEGTILITQGVSATDPRPELSGLAPAMAAARNYLHSLHGELAPLGIHAAVLHIAAMITGSAAHKLMTSGAIPSELDMTGVPTLAPEEIADVLWEMHLKRDTIERRLPA
jgi:short-subunit dehydrogenase